MGNFAFFFVVCWLFSKYIFLIFFQEYHQCHTVWIQIRSTILLGLIWVQTVCKCYHQMTLVGKELIPMKSSFQFGISKFEWTVHSAVGNMSGYRCVSDCKPGVVSSIPARSHTLVEIDHEIISTVILLPSAESYKKGCCQLQAKVCAWSTG